MRRARRLPVFEARVVYERLITPLRASARARGYALAVHGSLARDIDLIAVPWALDASAPELLVEALVSTCEENVAPHRAWVRNDPDADPFDFTRRSPEPKAHGRLAWSIYMSGSATYIDLSVMPLQPNALFEAFDAIRAQVVGNGRADTFIPTVQSEVLMQVKFRFYVNCVEEYVSGYKYSLSAVYNKQIDGDDPNRQFWESTPSGQMTFQVEKKLFPTPIWKVGEVIDLSGVPVGMI